jgi:hypothetical protein
MTSDAGNLFRARDSGMQTNSLCDASGSGAEFVAVRSVQMGEPLP